MQMFEQATQSETAQAYSQTAGGQPIKDTRIIRFFTRPLRNDAKSQEAGRPIHDDIDYIEIRVPGRRDVVCHPVRPIDRVRFGEQYEDWKKGREQVPEGTALAHWPDPSMTTAKVADLNGMHIYTVEQLAAMSDSTCQQDLGLMGLRNKAKDYLETAAGSSAPLERLRAEVADRDSKLAAQQQAIDELTAKVASLTVQAEQAPASGLTAEQVQAMIDASKPKRGRPRSKPAE